MINIQAIQADFPILSKKINDKPLVYLDSTASSLKPKQVFAKMDEYYSKYGVNIFRGVYKISEKATQEYESARKTIADFIGAKDEREIIFTRNATESINLVASSWGRQELNKGDNVVSTVMEHHANIVPWQQITKEKNAELRFLNINENGFLVLDNLGKIIDKSTRIVCFTYVSNVLGTINPIKKIIEAVKSINPNSLILLDAAQAVPHLPVDVAGLGADFLVFSSHKMLGPTGIGILWAKFKILDNMPPYQTGGEMIREVYLDHTIFNEVPNKFEAGTPNIAGTIGLAEAVRYLSSIGMAEIRNHELEITDYALTRFSQINDLIFYGPVKALDRGGVIAFNVNGIHPHDLAQLLDNDNVCIRSGHHCAMPLHQRLNIPASSRASFYIYNTRDDVDKLIEGIEKAKKILVGDIPVNRSVPE